VLPSRWAQSAITPIYKGGAESEPGNYRGIAVGTALAKLYATILNQRLTGWLEANGLRALGQGGNREDHRTTDHALLLRTLIEQYRHSGQHLHVVFVDLVKFFDTVRRDLLWEKLRKVGVTGWMLQAVQALYANVPMVVKADGNLSAPFQSTMGVKQGCPLSPTLSGIFLDDFERHVLAAGPSMELPSLGGQPVPPFLWADDLIVAALGASGAQAQLQVLADYGTRWGLTVSVAKTKTITFRKPNQVVRHPNLLFQGQELEQVDSFVYLGMHFHATKPFSCAGTVRAEAAERALFAMRSRCTELGLHDPVVLMQLFDALVLPVLLYGVEVWGAQDSSKGMQDCEKLHAAFLRRLLGVRTGTTGDVVLAEVGRFPLRATVAKLLGNFWNRLVTMEDTRLVKAAFECSLELAQQQTSSQRSSGQATWTWQVASFLCALGADCDVGNPRQVNVESLIAAAQEAQIASLLNGGVKAQEYLKIVGVPSSASYTAPAAYLQIVQRWPERKRLAQLRTGAHSLAVETGRWRGLPREERVCQRCGSGAVDDVRHMVFDCDQLMDERLQHPELFAAGSTELNDFFAQPPISLAGFVSKCFDACAKFYPNMRD